MSANDWFSADWPAPANVHTLITTRNGGVSQAPWNSFNLGMHVGDNPEHVSTNRETLRQLLPDEPIWLHQLHGTCVLNADEASEHPAEADASVSHRAGKVCVVLTADCLPLLLCNRAGSVVSAIHAGWRGLCDGVIENSVSACAVDNSELLAWLGPAIGPDAFEVGEEVRAAFIAHDPIAESAFTAITEGKYLADIYQLARQRLNALGVTQIYGGNFCTVIERDHFFSYRRDRDTGRMASLIWFDD
ncbi:peptidoglycan editing factor PgeF [Neisseriaceae bacterium TC5R-5]|nr:peptidoglycan editing factor PgeF [Neisseriaceae bacterium TC5R-5]